MRSLSRTAKVVTTFAGKAPKAKNAGGRNLVSQVGIGFLGFLLLDLLEGDRLLGLEHRLGIPLVPALDASHRLVLAEIVEALTALGTAALGAPFRLHHG
jgi:hypothetical protein